MKGESMNPLLLQRVLAVLAAVILLAGPLMFPGYLTFQLTAVMAYAVAAIGLNLITGYAGQISLGHNAFFALGAYCGALSMIHWQVHYTVSILIAAVVTFVVGLAAGFPAQRLKGLYLVLITLMLAVSVAPIIKHFRDLTGGMAGLSFDKPTPPAGLPINQDQWVYYIILACTVLCFWLARNFAAGSTHRALSAVRQAPLAAASLGVDVDWYKVLVFGIGSMLAGVGGALFNLITGFLAPDSFNLLLSVSFLAAIVVGGLGSIWGALVAGVFLQFVPSLASDISEGLAGAVYGGLLILCITLMPKGLVGTAADWWRQRRQASLATASPPSASTAVPSAGTGSSGAREAMQGPAAR